MSSKQALIRILVLGMALKVFIAATLPLGVDEAYATAVAREFSWSFYDHPPISFWSPVAAAYLTGVEHHLVYRLPFLLFGVLTTIVLYQIGKEAGSKRAGLWAALLFSVSPFFVLSGGTFIIPDGPLSAFSALAVLFLVRITKKGAQAPLSDWILCGVALAFALASKYQAALIPISALIFAVSNRDARRWFAIPGPYVASAIGLIGLAPVLLWNLQNDWASFAFHSGRTGDGLQLRNFTTMIVGQFIYLLPSVLVLAMIGLRAGVSVTRPPMFRLLVLVAVAPILVFNVIYLFSAQSYPHWTMPGWVFTLPLAGVWLADQPAARIQSVKRWLIGFGVPIWALLLTALLHANTGVLTRFTYDEPPKWDRTIDAFHWGGLLPKMRERGLLNGIDVVAATHWIEAGFVSTALEGRFPVRVLDVNAHHFALMKSATATGAALLMAPTRFDEVEQTTARLLARAQKYDPNAEVVDPVWLNRGGVAYAVVVIVRLTLTADPQ